MPILRSAGQDRWKSLEPPDHLDACDRGHGDRFPLIRCDWKRSRECAGFRARWARSGFLGSSRKLEHFEEDAVALAAIVAPRLRMSGSKMILWWLDRRFKTARSLAPCSSFIRKHLLGSPLANLAPSEVTPGKVETLLEKKDEEIAAGSVNHLRRFTYRIFKAAIRAERFHGENPVTKDVPVRYQDHDRGLRAPGARIPAGRDRSAFVPADARGQEQIGRGRRREISRICYPCATRGPKPPFSTSRTRSRKAEIPRG